MRNYFFASRSKVAFTNDKKQDIILSTGSYQCLQSTTSYKINLKVSLKTKQVERKLCLPLLTMTEPIDGDFDCVLITGLEEEEVECLRKWTVESQPGSMASGRSESSTPSKKPNPKHHQDSSDDDVDDDLDEDKNSKTSLPKPTGESPSVKTSIRVGEMYQAKIPTLINNKHHHVQLDTHEAVSIWKPTQRITESEIEAFIFMAKSDFGYSEEQSLGVLYINDFNLEKTKQILPTRIPSKPEELSDEDKMIFASAFLKFGDDLGRISKLLNHNPVPMKTLVYHYYQWQPECLMKSYIDFSDRDLIPKDATKLLQDYLASNPNSSKEERSGYVEKIFGSHCADCRIRESEGKKFIQMCKICRHYWLKTGARLVFKHPVKTLKTDTTSALEGRRPVQTVLHGVKPIDVNVVDLNIVAKSQPEHLNASMEGLGKQIIMMKIRNQKAKQKLEMDRRNLPEVGAMSYYRIGM
ncbi:unnamed protein product [Orchesella dallaii]|uniref:ELM2 domain-containing protein n=1 Tax=Orchesella dallaii TaxID=48710 RepID=A0ABP1RNX5_9HEXA